MCPNPCYNGTTKSALWVMGVKHGGSMAQLSYQQVQLLIRLLEACKPLSASELGASLNLSPRQVRYALGGTSGWLAGFDLALKMQPGVGIEVRGTDSRKEAALEALRDMKSRSRVWQPEQRRRLLALYLLMSDEAIILHHLQNVAKVSRRVIVSDLEHVGRWMERFYLGLKRRRNYGVWVDGTEKDKRQALAALMWGDFPEADGALRVVYEHGIQFAKATLPLCDLVLLTADMVDQVDVRRGLRFVARAEHAMSTRFTDEGGLALALAMAIQSWRIQQGRLVELPAEGISWLQGLPIWEVAANIGKQMAWWANVGTLPAAEIALLGATLMATPRDKPWSGDMAANPRLVEALEVFLADVAQTYQLPTLVDDVSLYDACLVQVVTRYFRERFGLWMPQYEVDLPAKYRREKEIAERLSSHLSERVGVPR